MSIQPSAEWKERHHATYKASSYRGLMANWQCGEAECKADNKHTHKGESKD